MKDAGRAPTSLFWSDMWRRYLVSKHHCRWGAGNDDPVVRFGSRLLCRSTGTRSGNHEHTYEARHNGAVVPRGVGCGDHFCIVSSVHALLLGTFISRDPREVKGGKAVGGVEKPQREPLF